MAFSPSERLRDLVALQRAVESEISMCLAMTREPERIDVQVARQLEAIALAQREITRIEMYRDPAKIGHWRKRLAEVKGEILHARHAADIERVQKLLALRDELSAGNTKVIQAACESEDSAEGLSDA